MYPKVPYLAHYFLSILLLFARWSQKIPSNIICWWHPAVHLFHSYKFCSISWHIPPYDILSWMNLNKLLLNPSKTEFLLIGTKQQYFLILLTYLQQWSVSSSARNLGFIFDSDMSFSDQIKSVSKSCHFHIRDIRRIRHLLPLSAATALANSLVSSKLDYCNHYTLASHKSISTNFNAFKTHWHASSQTSKYQHITPILLHWLPIKQRIDYKLCLLTYKTLTNQQPTYTIVFHFLHILFLQDLLITRSFHPYVRSSLAKGLSLSSVHVSGIHSLLIPETRLLYQYSVPGSKHTSSKLLSSLALSHLPGLSIYILILCPIEWHLC